MTAYIDLNRCFVLLCPLLRFSILGRRCMELIRDPFTQIDSLQCLQKCSQFRLTMFHYILYCDHNLSYSPNQQKTLIRAIKESECMKVSGDLRCL
jgi:hypothetical protein